MVKKDEAKISKMFKTLEETFNVLEAEEKGQIIGLAQGLALSKDCNCKDCTCEKGKKENARN